jgi:ethanolamine utilization protein EutA
LLLVDIGGATAKLVIVHDGHVEATAALAIGGRLIVIDREDRVVRLDPAGMGHAGAAGFDWDQGDRIAPADLAAVGERMAERLAAAIVAVVAGDPAPSASDLLLTEWLHASGAIDGVLFSGGVAEYLYARETRHFGDLAPSLGKSLRRRIDDAGLPLREPRERIRATALGAASHAMQMSGDTIFLSSHARLLPRRNLPVVRPASDLSGAIHPTALARAIRAERELLGWLDREVAVAVPWRGVPTHARLRALAEGIVGGVEDRLVLGDALYVMTEGDIARSLGAILKEELALAAEILVVDGVTLHAFDHVDLGRIRLPSGRVPVTIKSLRFGTLLAAAG